MICSLFTTNIHSKDIFHFGFCLQGTVINIEEVGKCAEILPTRVKKVVKHFSLVSLCISGIGGNLVAIQASRISTYLHLHSIPGELPEEAKGFYYPCRTYCGTGASELKILSHISLSLCAKLYHQ